MAGILSQSQCVKSEYPLLASCLASMAGKNSIRKRSKNERVSDSRRKGFSELCYVLMNFRWQKPKRMISLFLEVCSIALWVVCWFLNSPSKCRIYASVNRVSVGSDNSAPTHFNEILIKIQNFSFTKMQLEISSAKRPPFCPGRDELKAFVCLFNRLINCFDS